ncbi:NAD-dependent epimerase/dehydratase family protein [Pelodictyon luteolum]|uniref:Probable UDP-glucose 4-epimerase n=1 Tax=Chlorobium luteolum (strain DSM 273 / BCRC 81028 / 2530) TaxID=319225 RepID=Q3B1T3_CHLL3|nr:SDR family oxidoreductase [Pelodictyon luteolum]ABB24698.1 probable UDP-glucose 4-epimerase [Pelodictyon luteolum DSM 273]
MNTETVWITGTHGFIGRHLAAYLNSKGCRVAGIGHGLWPEMEAMHWGVSFWLNGEIQQSNLAQLRSIAGLPDVVYHLAGGSSVGAAIANPYEDFRRTVVSTAELLEWLRKHSPHTRLVSVSSAAVYGGGHSGNIAEATSLSPYSPYGAHKLIMEELCHSYGANFGLSIVLPRLFSVYGPELKKQLLWDICTRLESGLVPLVLGGSGNELRDWTDVRDVVRALAMLAMMASESVPSVNVGTGVGTTVREIAERITRVWSQRNGREISVELSGKSRPGDPFSLIAYTVKLDETGFRWKIPLEKGLDDYVQWFCKGNQHG